MMDIHTDMEKGTQLQDGKHYFHKMLTVYRPSTFGINDDDCVIGPLFIFIFTLVTGSDNFLDLELEATDLFLPRPHGALVLTNLVKFGLFRCLFIPRNSFNWLITLAIATEWEQIFMPFQFAQLVSHL